LFPKHFFLGLLHLSFFLSFHFFEENLFTFSNVTLFFDVFL
jgi:hypothetical protein